MLAFFRKYQKGLFIVVSVLVLASFSFFGVQKANFDKQVVEKDGEVGIAIDGSKIRLLELNRLKRFIRTDAHDMQMLMMRDMPNMLNDGVIRTDFIQSGLAKELLIAYKAELEQEFGQRLTKLKRFKPYAHKEAPFLSVEGLWEHVLPELKEAFVAFKKIPSDEYERNVDALLSLYLYEQKFPPHMLKQFLHYQAQQYKWVQPDNELVNGNFALFRAKHIGDWFGEQGIDLIAQTILNGAIVAKKEGYTVTQKEAKASLYENARQALASQQGGKATDKEVVRFVTNQLQHVHLTEQDAVALWQKVLLFRKYFQDVGSSVLVDTLTAKTYQEYLDKKVEKKVYHFAEPIALHSFRDMLQLQYYIDAVTNPQARKSMHTLDLPQAVLPAEHVEKRVAELTYMPFTTSVRSVKKSEVLLEIPVQDVWGCQLEETHFKKLQANFPELAGKACVTEEARQEKLDGLSEQVREKVDMYTREELFARQPELLQQMLTTAEAKEMVLAISLGNVEEPLPGITDTKGLRDALLTAEKPVESFSQDGEHFYAIEVTEKPESLSLLSYKEAKQKGVLDGLLTRQLEQKYPAIRTELPQVFKDAEGNWKSFHAVRDEVGREVYKNVCRSLDTYAKKTLNIDEYAEHRFDYFFDKIRGKIEDGKTPQELLGIEAGQWRIEEEEVTSIRSKIGAWYDESAFEASPDTWSNAKMTADGKPFIYCVTASGVDTDKLPELIEKERSALIKEAKKELLLELIAEMQEKDAIHFLYDQGE